MRRRASAFGLAVVLAIGLSLVLALGLAGCQQDAEDSAMALCTIVCRCESSLPSEQRACVDECVPEAAVEEIPNACLQCIFERSASCSDLGERCFSNGPCDDPPRPSGDGGIPDAPLPF
jgi:hypothetical protein